MFAVCLNMPQTVRKHPASNTYKMRIVKRQKSTIQPARIYLSKIAKGEKEALQEAALNDGFLSLSGWMLWTARQRVKKQQRHVK
jgi:hypothetical protein